MKEITISELIKIINDDINIIDIRDNYQYNLGKIENSINIPMNFLLKNPSEYLNKDERYYIYCDYGNRSRKCTLLLSNEGYDVVNIKGGYNNYFLYSHHI